MAASKHACAAMASPGPPVLESTRHVRYWHRCLRTFLPTGYTSSDSTRMALGFFIVGSLDLLSVPAPAPSASVPDSTHPPSRSISNQPLLTPAERRAIRDWALSLRHPHGGFCGSPYHLLPAHTAPLGQASTPNIAATYFALLLLALAAGTEQGGPDEEQDTLAEGAFAAVDRVATLRWLRSLQRADGSFGEIVVGGDDQDVCGGRDMRFCYLAAAIRWCLRGAVEAGDTGWVEDIDVPALIAHIRRAQTYDGGMAENHLHESHAGYAFCAVAALTLLDRPLDGSPTPPDCSALRDGVANMDALLRFLAFRQFRPVDKDENENIDHGATPVHPPASSDHGCDTDQDHGLAGFNGRWGKDADSCYFWWVAGTLKLLDSLDLVDTLAAQRFHLEKMQHQVGGFSKVAGDPPDMYHSYLGLAVLGITDAPSVKKVDAALTVGADIVLVIVKARDGLIKRDAQMALLVNKAAVCHR